VTYIECSKYINKTSHINEITYAFNCNLFYLPAVSECNKEIALMGDRNTTYSFSSPGWPTGYAANLHCNWVFTSPPGTHLVLKIMTMDLEETNDCVADSVSVYSGYALTSTTDAHLESKLCLANSSMSLITGTNVMTVKFDTDMFENKTGFNAYVYRGCLIYIFTYLIKSNFDINIRKFINVYRLRRSINRTQRSN